MPSMKTRRRGKPATDGDDNAHGTADSTHQEDVTLELELPDDLDIATLTSLLPDASLDAPSAQTILALYQLVLNQVVDIDAAHRDVDEQRAELEKKDVELDQIHQDRETTVKDLEAVAESAQNEAKLAKGERDQLASTCAALQVQLSALNATSSSASSEVDSLKRQVADVEREKRDLMGVVSRLQDDNTAQNDEVRTLRTTLKQARQDHQELESSVRELRSVETSNKFKSETLEQQLKLAKEENERTHVELAAKIDEYAKYRKEKHAELVQLQTAQEALTQSQASSQSTLQALQKAHASQNHQLTQSLQRVQDLTGQLADQEARFSTEMTSMRRLVQMLEEKDARSKDIVESIERDWAGVGAKADAREHQLLDQIEREKRRCEALEKQVDEYRGVLDRIDAGELPIPGKRSDTAAADMDPVMQGMAGLSPTVAMASRVQKSGKTFTEVYADYINLQERFAKKSTEYDHMERTLSSVLTQIEERAPILAQQRVEYERLQAESAQLASQLSHAIRDRDAQSHAHKEVAQKLAQTETENGLVRKQLSDLGRQVQMLSREIARRDDPTIPSDHELENVPPAEDIEAVITNNLVLFRSIPELQEQNQKLLKVVRDLGAKMEAEEKEYKAVLEKEQADALAEAHDALVQLQVQLTEQTRASEVTIQAYVKERDALKSMLARSQRGSNGMVHTHGHNGADGAGDELQKEKELAQAQETFESYQKELSLEGQRLREDLNTAHRESGQLGAALAKANARIEFLNDRHRIAQEEMTAQTREIDSLMDRNQQLYDKYTRVDIECNRAMEEASLVHSQLEKLRNESANLRAEKRIWESVQSRLTEENKSLVMERSRMSDLLTNVQKMHNDLERSNENDRRRLETQISTYEVQMQDMRAQLSQERETIRQLNLQKDVEIKELTVKAERIAQDHVKDHESLLIAQTSKVHLEERVADLTRMVKGSEEKLSVYERRPATSGGPSDADQGLESELAELRAQLKVAQLDLETARSHVAQFQEISKANEAALASLSNTYEDYKVMTESQLVARESDYNALEEKLEALQRELLEASEKYSALQTSAETERTTFAEEKRELEGAIADVSSAQKNWDTDRASRESQLQQQEQRVKSAEERYRRELIAHAESVKQVERLKQQLATVQASVREALASAETSKSNLVTSETSWKQQKDALDKELAEVNLRCKDLTQQNELLHQHLQSAHSQAELIRKTAETSSVKGDSMEQVGTDEDVKTSELRSVIAFLRREKEIVGLQLELGKQENARLRAQIETLSQSLDDTRNALSEERVKALESANSSVQHAELMEKINQVAILRESNTTIRAECEGHAKRARELEAKLRRLNDELGPAKEQARSAQAELDARDAQLKKAEEEVVQWQTRNQHLLTKFDRSDPAELQSLKEQVEKFTADLANESERTKKLSDHIRKVKEIRGKDGDVLRASKAALAEAQNELQTIIAARDELQAQLESKAANSDEALKLQLNASKGEIQTLQRQLAAANREKAALIKEAAESMAQAQTVPSSDQSAIIISLQEERDKLLAEKAAAPVDKSMEDARKEWEAEKDNLNKQRQQLITLSTNKQTAMQNKITALTQQLDEASKSHKAELDHLTKDKEQALLTKASSSTPASAQTDEQHAKELRDLEARLKAEHQIEMKTAVETAVAAAKAEGSTKVDQEAAIAAAIAAHDKDLEAKHAEEIAAAVERGRQEQAKRSQLKDAQLVKTRDRVKELEALQLEYKKAGFIPEGWTPPTAAATPQKTDTAAATSSGATSLPRKPSVVVPVPATTAPNPTNPTTPTATRGRGAARGARGVGRGAGVSRGGGPPRPQAVQAAAAAAASSTPTPSGGVSIMGAATKRAREDTDTSTDDTLAKRIKGVEGGSKPVVLRRPPPS